MRSHISVHRATTKYFSNSFVFKNEIEKEGLPGDIAPALGAGGPRFKSGRPDHNIVCIFGFIVTGPPVAYARSLGEFGDVAVSPPIEGKDF
jgi:hypothetical protein